MIFFVFLLFFCGCCSLLFFSFFSFFLYKQRSGRVAISRGLGGLDRVGPERAPPAQHLEFLKVGGELLGVGAQAR